MTSGNIGTLIRHRGLALPYLVWLAALGAVRAACALAAPHRRHSFWRRGRSMAMLTNAGGSSAGSTSFDAIVVVLLLGLMPLAYGGYLLFRTPPPTLTASSRRRSSTDRTCASRFSGENLRPFMRVSFGTHPGHGGSCSATRTDARGRPARRCRPASTTSSSTTTRRNATRLPQGADDRAVGAARCADRSSSARSAISTAAQARAASRPA